MNALKNYRNWMNAGAEAAGINIALLLARIAFGGMMLISHGLPKLKNFSAYSEKFPDPLGIGNSASMAMAIVGEVFCSAVLMMGAATRIAAAQLVATMSVAAFLVHKADPFFASPGSPSKEFALVYLVAFAVILLAGPGKYSVDAIIAKKLTPSDK